MLCRGGSGLVPDGRTRTNGLKLQESKFRLGIGQQVPIYSVINCLMKWNVHWRSDGWHQVDNLDFSISPNSMKLLSASPEDCSFSFCCLTELCNLNCTHRIDKDKEWKHIDFLMHVDRWNKDFMVSSIYSRWITLKNMLSKWN